MEEQQPQAKDLDPAGLLQETLDCLAQINQAVLRREGLEAALAAFAAGANRLVPFHRLALACFDRFPPGEQWVIGPPGSVGEQVARQTLSASDRPLLALVQRTRQPLIIPNIHEHRFAALPELVAEGIQAVMILPLPGDTARPAGGLSFYSLAQEVYSRQAALDLAPLVQALAVAVQQDGMKEQASQAEARLHDLSLRLLRAHEDERAILARELHDEVGQALTALKLNLRSALEPGGPQQPADLNSILPTLRDSLRLASELLEKVRGLSIDLHPPMLDDLGLAAALRWYARQASQRGGLALHLSVADDLPPLPRDVALTFFRIGQEAITNTLRHAGAANLWVQLRQAQDGACELHITDDGSGFALGESGLQTYAQHSLGLRAMQERADLLGAHFEVETAPGKGTRVSVIWQPGDTRHEHPAGG